MSIGAGIAIAGAWLFAVACAVSGMSDRGMWTGLLSALAVTWWLK